MINFIILVKTNQSSFLNINSVTHAVALANLNAVTSVCLKNSDLA